MKKFVSALLICMMVLAMAASVCAESSNTLDRYSNKTLPKLTDADLNNDKTKAEPNVLLVTSSSKVYKRTDKPFMHRFTKCIAVSGGRNINETQCVKLWRDDGKSVTKPLWHPIGGNPHELGNGASNMKPNYCYKLKCRGNTKNKCSVKVSGWVCADYTDPN